MVEFANIMFVRYKFEMSLFLHHLISISSRCVCILVCVNHKFTPGRFYTNLHVKQVQPQWSHIRGNNCLLVATSFVSVVQHSDGYTG
jgi:hypothetical protein